MISIRARVCFAFVLTSVAACGYSREGWGRGRYFVVSESSTLQVRRSAVRLDEATGDLVVNWIGVRAPHGAPAFASYTVTVFKDLDGDRVPDEGEIRAHRESNDTSSKLLFSDVRVSATDVEPGLRARVQTCSTSGTVKTRDFAFEPDP